MTGPQPIKLPADTDVGQMRVGTVVNADDPTDVAVLLQLGPFRAVMTPDAARQLGENLTVEAAYAAVCFYAATNGHPMPSAPPAPEGPQ